MNRRVFLFVAAAVAAAVVIIVPTAVVLQRRAASRESPPGVTTTTASSTTETTAPANLSVLAPIAPPSLTSPNNPGPAPTTTEPVSTLATSTTKEPSVRGTSSPVQPITRTNTPTSAPVAGSPAISLQLVYAPTNEEILELTDGAVIDLTNLGVPSIDFNVRANPLNNAVVGVDFAETGRKETTQPWAFCGDNGGDYTSCSELKLGQNSVTATPLLANNNALPAMSISFVITGELPIPDSVLEGPLPDGRWIEIEAEANIDARHEACFVMVNRRAYLVGGRGTKALDIFDPVTRIWSTGETPPIQMHHMQCVAAQGKLWVVAAWTQWYPREETPEFIYVYDPATDAWSTRTAMPIDRRRGAAAVIVSADESKIYVSHGNRGGHETGDHAVSLPYLDEYDIGTDTWKALSSNVPNPRDHCGGGLIDGRLCVAGGRNGGELNWPEVAPTDCYDLATGTWSVEAPIPNPRGGSSYGTTCDGKLMVAGGEGSGKAWDTVEVFDGTSWAAVDSLVVGRHGSGLAIDCVCDTITIASGAAAQGGGPEIRSVEMFFPNGVDSSC